MRNHLISISIHGSLRLLFLVAVLLSISAGAGNWPGWRGSDGSGISNEKNLPVRWSASENVRWRIALPDRGNSTPIVWGDRIFITQALEKESQRTVMCLNRADGKLLWQKGVTYKEAEETHETNPYCSASPVTDGERVIAWFGSAGVHAYDFSGKELWSRAGATSLGQQAHGWGYASSPLMHGDLCILYFGPGKGSFLVALDKRTGKTVWRTDEPPMQDRERTDGFRGQKDGRVGSFSSPLIVKAGDREELIMSYPQLVCAYDPKTGKELWRCDGLNELIYTSPIAGEGVAVAMGGFSGTTIAIKPGGKGDVTGTHRLWQSVRTKNRLGSGVIHDGYIYVLNMTGVAECLELKTGKSVWDERLPSRGPKGESWSSLVLAGDHIYALNQSGDTIVFKASPKFEVVAVNALESELTNASPAISDGELFVRTHKHLWCINGSKTTANR